MNIIKKISAGIASASLLAVVLSPVALAADVTVTVSGNGADSNSNVEVANTNKTVVEQATSTVAYTTILSGATTGGNTISNTTGGEDSDPKITTGNAKVTNEVNVTGGNNHATVTSCGCDSTTVVDVKNNGADSKQKVKLSSKNVSKVAQVSETAAMTMVMTDVSTGLNKIKGTTGGTMNSIKTGAATVKSKVSVTGSSNYLN